MKALCRLLGAVGWLVTVAGYTAPGDPGQWPTQPLTLADALNLALEQNAEVRKARQDLEAATGVAIQTRAVVIPKLQATAQYTARDAGGVEQFPVVGLPIQIPNEAWSAGVRLVQSVYEGGRLRSAWRSARLTEQQARAAYDTAVADTVLAVRTAYADVLLAAEMVRVHQASVELLEEELRQTRQRFEAGTVPRFNVLRAEVELANARPRLSRARNSLRIAKQNLAHLLGFDVPAGFSEDLPLELADRLEPPPGLPELNAALRQALEHRSELAVLRHAEALQAESVRQARAAFKPALELFAGYDAHSPNFRDELDRVIDGWVVGAQMRWNLFDGGLSRGKLVEARARQARAQVEIEDAQRRIELEVRTAYSRLVEAREVLQSTLKVQEQAEEALRLAQARASAGTGTQLDVLSAQTALTEARSIHAQALRDFVVAQARFERAIGQPRDVETNP
ncbi:TolC family protein [Limisphaera sp. VF-2]|jgi:outer membrane protein|uniref:TolC family protein n=1 Tax=Limisphaera sp. VF-2 TaxID=3400418 RepID=UPI002567AB83|nr:TolC family protein [Limisphaera sp.]